MSFDPNAVRLGRRPVRHDPRTLKMARYAPDPLPAIPEMHNWGAVLADWGMFLNDRIGDCTAAAAAHIVMANAAARGVPVSIGDDDVLAMYSATSGYEPSNPASDNGAVEIDVLNYWRQTGLAGHKLLAYVAVPCADLNRIKEAIYLFGSVYAGVNLPISAQDQDVWSVTVPRLGGDAAPGSWGGHCVAPWTRVLTADLEWVPIERMKTGDKLIGFDEMGMRRKYRPSTVESSTSLSLPCYELEFEDATCIVASADHLWLTDCGGETRWLPTEKMRVRGPGGSYGTKVLKPLKPWQVDLTRDAGYLAAAFDGEGWLSCGAAHRGIHKLGFVQRENEMLGHVRSALRERKFLFADNLSSATGFKKKKYPQIRISGRQELLRFLGSVRPHRLLSKFDANRIGELQSDRCALVGMKFIGAHPVIALGTSTRTYIAEGLASHNCVPLLGYDSDAFQCVTWGAQTWMTAPWWLAYGEEAYAPITVDWCPPDGVSPSHFNLDQLKADLAAL